MLLLVVVRLDGGAGEMGLLERRLAWGLALILRGDCVADGCWRSRAWKLPGIFEQVARICLLVFESDPDVIDFDRRLNGLFICVYLYCV